MSARRRGRLTSGQLRGKPDRAGLPGYPKLFSKKPFSWLALFRRRVVDLDLVGAGALAGC